MEISRLVITLAVLHNLIDCCVTSELDDRLSAKVEKELLYGYQIGDITQGIGYGHYLHPFYYQGASKKYYKCAVEGEWKPLSGYRAPVASNDQVLGKPQKNISSVKKYQHLDEKLKMKVTLGKKDYALTVRRPRENFSNSATRKHYRIQNRNDDGMLEGEQTLQKDHAKLVRDINDLSEDQPFLKILPEHDEISTLESDNDQNINIAESSGKEYIIHNGYPSDNQVIGYKVHENIMDIPQMLPKAPHPQKFKPPLPIMPFQNFKKFRIITVKPQSVVHLKYSGGSNIKNPTTKYNDPINNLVVRPQYLLKEPILVGNHYPSISSGTQNDHYQQRPQYELPLKPMAFRKGLHHFPTAISRHPRLTALEQFLLLFPKVIW